MILSKFDTNEAALDHYLSGVKINPSHFECVYNLACSFFTENKYNNAFKWFNHAILINSTSADSYFGKALTCLKLGDSA